MIKLIVGNKGSGKTKQLIAQINSAAKTCDGNLVCIEQAAKLTYDVDHSVRLISTDEYKVTGFDAFYGFICGLLAGNYDIKEIYVDGIRRICGRSLEDFDKLVSKLNPALESAGVSMTFTVSCDMSELPEGLRSLAQ